MKTFLYLRLLCLLGFGYCVDENSTDTKIIFNDITIQDDNSSTYDDLRIYGEDNFGNTIVKFYLRTPDNETFEINGTSPLLNSSRPMKILIHGEQETHQTGWIDEMTTKYHTAGGVDVVVVDWSLVSASTNLLDVTAVDEAGQVIGDFIMEVTTDNVNLLSEIHIIGNDLGAHVGGAAGEKVQNCTSQKVGRITGLDPCNNVTNDILSSDDANFVDCIHTQSYFEQNSYGTVDFYVLSNDTSKVFCINETCAVNSRASDLYTDTIINEDVYWAVACDNQTLFLEELCVNNTDQIMGEHVPTNITGKYFMKPSAGATLNVNNFMLIMCFWYFIFYLFK